MNEEQIEAHRAQFEKEWAEDEAWRLSPNAGLSEDDIAMMKACLWRDYIGNTLADQREEQ